MVLKIIRCPNCGGDIDINDKKCPYCQSDVLDVDYEKKREMIRSMLYAAESELISQSYNRCIAHLQDVVKLDNDCSDAWFMFAVLYSDDQTMYNQNLQKGRASKTSYGIFSEDEIGRYVKSDQEEVQEIARFGFTRTFVLVLVIGAMISIILGIVFKTFIPAIILAVILALMVIAHFILTWICFNVE